MREGTGPQVMECPECHGSTWKRERVPSKRDPARLREVAVRCDCFYENRTASLLKAARIPERYAGEYELDFHGENPSRKLAEFRAAKMVQEYPAEKAGLLFVGPIGVGKTHLACATLHSLILAGHAGLFYSY